MCLFPIFLVMCTTFKSCRPISLHTWTNDFIFLLNTRGLYIQRKNQRPTHLTSRYIHVLTNEAWNVFLAKITWGYLTGIVEAKNVAREADYSRRVCRIWDSYFHRQRKLCRDDKKKPHWIYPTSVQLFYTIFNSEIDKFYSWIRDKLVMFFCKMIDLWFDSGHHCLNIYGSQYGLDGLNALWRIGRGRRGVWM